VAIVVPLYWVTYSPWNFLYFCDVALLVTAMAIWIESPLLVSTQAVAIVAMQTLWVIGGEKGEKRGREPFLRCVFVNPMTFIGLPRGEVYISIRAQPRSNAT
jgi:hypothetical protein